MQLCFTFACSLPISSLGDDYTDQLISIIHAVSSNVHSCLFCQRVLFVFWIRFRLKTGSCKGATIVAALNFWEMESIAYNTPPLESVKRRCRLLTSDSLTLKEALEVSDRWVSQMAQIKRQRQLISTTC